MEKKAFWITVIFGKVTIGSIMELDEIFACESSSDSEHEYPIVTVNGIELRLMNKHHSLWGELIWCCGKIVSKAILGKNHGIDFEKKTVIEFGSGSGLCSIASSISGAKLVLATDYPDDCIIENLHYNCDSYPNIKICGHKWGEDVSKLLELNGGERFDRAILCDLVFNHSEHKKLLKSLCAVLKSDGVAYLSYTHHRVHLIQEDLKFIEYATKKFGLNCSEVFTERHPPMFPNDPGDLDIRTLAYVYALTFK